MSSIEKAIHKLKINSGAGSLQESSMDTNKSALVSGINVDERTSHLVLDKLVEQGFCVPDIKDNKRMDEYRHIKRPLLMNAFGNSAAREERANLVMITSALSGEGKTYTTLNLAMSIAMERDRTVLVVDCDSERSSLSNTLGLGGSVGLIDLLLGEISDVKEIIVSTDVPKFTVIPAGKMYNFSTELYASERMESLLNELSKRYSDRVILFDSPPLLQTSQAKVLAKYFGQILLVVEEGKTMQKFIVEAVSYLDSNKIIGSILNKSSYSDIDDYGYYGQRDE